MNCQDISRLLNAYVDTELDLGTAVSIEEHLQACVRCREHERGLRTVRSVVRRHTDFRTAPDSLRSRLEMAYGSRRVSPPSILRRRSLMVVGFAMVLLTALAALRGSVEPATSVGAASRVVYHISNSDNAGAALRNLANHLEASPGVKIVVIAHNDGVDFLLRGARDESGRPYAATVAKFRERGVEFRVCKNTLVRRNIDTGEVIPGAALVPSGIAEIGRLQSEEGYAYMRL